MSLPLALHLPFLDESAVILVIGLLLFGKRLPEIMRGLGGSVKEFKKGMDEGPKLETPVTVPPPPAAPAPHATISRDWIPPSQPMGSAAPPLPPAAAPAPTPPSEPK